MVVVLVVAYPQPQVKDASLRCLRPEGSIRRWVLLEVAAPDSVSGSRTGSNRMQDLPWKHLPRLDLLQMMPRIAAMLTMTHSSSRVKRHLPSLSYLRCCLA